MMRPRELASDLVCHSSFCNGLETPRSSQLYSRLFGRSVSGARTLISERLSLGAETDLAKSCCAVWPAHRLRATVQMRSVGRHGLAVMINGERDVVPRTKWRP